MSDDTMTVPIGPIKQRILAQLSDGKPAWTRSFQPCKRNLGALIDAGLVERVTPPNGRARNMVAITGDGIDALRAAAAQAREADK